MPETPQQRFAKGRAFWQQYVNLNGYAFAPNTAGIRALARHTGIKQKTLRQYITAFLEA